MLRTLAKFLFTDGYNSSSGKLSQNPNEISDGSSNVLFSGTTRNSIFKGVKVTAGPMYGGKISTNVGDTFGALGDYNETGIGSIFRILGAIFFIGAGKLYYSGAEVSGTSASTTLQIKKIVAGALGTTYQAGLAKPSAPTISAVSPVPPYTGKNNGVVSAKIARIRGATGAKSNASLASNIITTVNQCVAITFPSADNNGQDYWEIDVTKNAEGAVGNHYFLQELPESVLTQTITATAALTAASNLINVPNDSLTAAHIGWLYRVYRTDANTVVAAGGITTSGNAKSVVTATGLTNSPVTVTVPVTIAGHGTATLIAAAFRTALAADEDVGAAFAVAGSGAEIILTAKTSSISTLNFTIEDDTSDGITDDVTSTNVTTGDTETYITGVGADDSGGAGFQEITLELDSAVTGTVAGNFVRGVNGIARSYVFEWRDSDLIGADLAPVRDYPPPAGIFAGSSGDVAFVDGALGDTVDVTTYARDNLLSSANTTTTYVGNAIAVSDPAKPESFPPDNYIFTGDAPTGLISGGSGIYWRFAVNSLGVIRYVGGSPAISYERLWVGIGIRKQHNACLGAGGRLYAYTGQRGLVRLGVNGEPDTTFATPIELDMESWTPDNVVLAYDADHQMVLCMHEQTILAFHEPTGRWSAPLDASDSLGGSEVIKSAVNVNGSSYLAYSDGTSAAIYYQFNVAQTGVNNTGVVTTPWMRSDEVVDIISRLHVDMRTSSGELGNAVDVSVFRNGGGSAVVTLSATPPDDGFSHLSLLRPNVRNAKSWRVKLSYTESDGTDAGFEGLRVEGESQNIGQ